MPCYVLKKDRDVTKCDAKFTHIVLSVVVVVVVCDVTSDKREVRHFVTCRSRTDVREWPTLPSDHDAETWCATRMINVTELSNVRPKCLTCVCGYPFDE